MFVTRLLRAFTLIFFKIDLIFLRSKNEIAKSAILEKGYYTGDGKLVIDEYCYIGPGAYVNFNGEIRIGRGTIIGPNVTILSQNHVWFNQEISPYSMGYAKKKVDIGDGCWIGEGVRIAPGVSIGRGSIIGIGCVLTKSIPPYSIVKSDGLVVCEREDKKQVESNLCNNNFYIRIKKDG